MNLSRRGFAALIAAAVLPGALGQGSAFAQVVILERPMPPPRMEVIPVAPGPGYNWVPGHWAWRGAEWVWIPGHHIQGVVAPMPAPLVETIPVAPQAGWHWVRGHYVWEPRGWVWNPGHWVP